MLNKEKENKKEVTIWYAWIVLNTKKKSTLPKLITSFQRGKKSSHLITDLPSFTPLENLMKERKNITFFYKTEF